MLTLQHEAQFIWLFDDEFFVETPVGDFIWSDEGYNGTGTMRPTDLSYGDYCKKKGISFGRAKGKHLVGEYCGNEVKIVQRLELVNRG
jgi:hypothetical protein